MYVPICKTEGTLFHDVILTQLQEQILCVDLTVPIRISLRSIQIVPPIESVERKKM